MGYRPVNDKKTGEARFDRDFLIALNAKQKTSDADKVYMIDLRGNDKINLLVAEAERQSE